MNKKYPNFFFFLNLSCFSVKISIHFYLKEIVITFFPTGENIYIYIYIYLYIHTHTHIHIGVNLCTCFENIHKSDIYYICQLLTLFYIGLLF